MEGRKLQIPGGMQDTLPGECAHKRRLESELRQLFQRSGYQEIETPILEYYDALDDQTYGYRPEQVWKTFDSRGRVLAIRPDSTIPAVRLASGRLKDAPLPLRLCYVQSAAHYFSDTLSMLCAEPQAGVELMGEGGVEADAEVIALAIEALKLSGLRDFQIELGQAGFFTGFMQEAGLTDSQCEVMRRLTEQKNALEMQLYLEKLSVSADAARRLMHLPRLYGDIAVLDEAEQLTPHPLCRSAIRSLREVIRILRAWGLEEYITIDLGMVHQAGYYSGMIFRGMTADLGQPLLSGGRYDGLPARFGREIPATGFAVKLKLLMMALERQGASFTAPVPDVMLAFAPDALAQAVAYARGQRAQGVSVAMLYGASRDALQEKLLLGIARSAVYVTAEGAELLEREAE
ncbi:MAG: ATP phosphoribosyltransferase regulatory subunit [Clostridia bacterium]|nr:ATP phosphoribosyltransferase regulatory subunit [Clostridia bacterium]